MRENKQQISFHKLLCNYLVYTRRCAHISIPRYTILSAIPYDRERKYSFDLSFYFSFYFRQRIALYSNLYSLYFSLPIVPARDRSRECSLLLRSIRLEGSNRRSGIREGRACAFFARVSRRGWKIRERASRSLYSP